MLRLIPASREYFVLIKTFIINFLDDFVVQRMLMIKEKYMLKYCECSLVEYVNTKLRLIEK